MGNYGFYSQQSADSKIDGPSLKGKDFIFKGESLLEVTRQMMEKHNMHKSIGTVVFKRNQKGEAGAGSGFLISSNLLVTSAHHVYSQERGDFHLDIKFYPGLVGQSSSARHYEPERESGNRPCAFVPEEFKDGSSHQQHDYALVKLQGNVRLYTYMTVGLNFTTTKQVVGVYGYPHKHIKLADTRALNDYGKEFTAYQYGRAARDRLVSDSQMSRKGRLAYQLTTESGLRGSPVVIIDERKNNVAVAVHQSGQEGRHCYGRLFTLDMLLVMKVWSEQKKAESFTAVDTTNNQEIFLGDKLSSQIAPIFDRKVNSPPPSPRSSCSSDTLRVPSKCPDCNNHRKQMEALEKKRIRMENEYQNQIRALQKRIEIMKKEEATKVAAQHPESNRNIYSKSPYMWDSNSPSVKKFEIYGKVITKTSVYDENYYHLTGDSPLPTRFSVTLKVVSYGGKNCISFGVMTEKVRKQPLSTVRAQEQSVELWSWPSKKNGWVKKNEMSSDAIREWFVPVGGMLSIEGDSNKGTLRFTNLSNMHCMDYGLGPAFKGQNLYFYAAMEDPQTSVQLVS